MTASINIQSEKASILLIYTGGTIGMIENPETGVLESFNFHHLKDNMPELKKLGVCGFDHSVRSGYGFIGDGAGVMDEDRKDYCRQLPVVRRLCRASWYGHDVFHGICFEFYAGKLK